MVTILLKYDYDRTLASSLVSPTLVSRLDLPGYRDDLMQEQPSSTVSAPSWVREICVSKHMGTLLVATTSLNVGTIQVSSLKQRPEHLSESRERLPLRVPNWDGGPGRIPSAMLYTTNLPASSHPHQQGKRCLVMDSVTWQPDVGQVLSWANSGGERSDNNSCPLNPIRAIRMKRW